MGALPHRSPRSARRPPRDDGDRLVADAHDGADRAARPVAARHHLADDGDRVGSGFVARAEVAAGAQRHAEYAQVAGRHQVGGHPPARRGVGTGGGQAHDRHVLVALQRERLRQRHLGAHAAREARAEGVVECGGARAVVALQADVHARDRHARGVVAGVGVQRGAQAAQEEPRAREQHQAERELRHHQRGAQPGASESLSSTPERACHVGARGLQGRK
jgi:hypothetical protein